MYFSVMRENGLQLLCYCAPSWHASFFFYFSFYFVSEHETARMRVISLQTQQRVRDAIVCVL